jgi:hypothetical protein
MENVFKVAMKSSQQPKVRLKPIWNEREEVSTKIFNEEG